MSIRFEWFSADSTTASYVGPGRYVTDGELASPDEVGAEYATDADQHAIVLADDEATVLTGTVGELRGLLQRALAALDAAEPALPALPTPPPFEDDYGTVTCPYVHDDGTVCGAQVNIWDKEPVRRDLRFQDGAFVAGPSRVADDGGGDEEIQCYELHSWAVPAIDEWQ